MFLKFVTCLLIPFFLNNRSIVYFADGGSRGGGGEGSFIGQFLVDAIDG